MKTLLLLALPFAVVLALAAHRAPAQVEPAPSALGRLVGQAVIVELNPATHVRGTNNLRLSGKALKSDEQGLLLQDENRRYFVPIGSIYFVREP